MTCENNKKGCNNKIRISTLMLASMVCMLSVSDMLGGVEEIIEEASEETLCRNMFTMGYTHRLASIIPVPIWTKQLPYKEYFYGLSCGIVWYSKEQSEGYKNLKIGTFRLTWSLYAFLISFAKMWKDNSEYGMSLCIFWSLIPTITFINLKYKRLEICFVDISTILSSIVIVYMSNYKNTLAALLWLVPAVINIDIS